MISPTQKKKPPRGGLSKNWRFYWAAARPQATGRLSHLSTRRRSNSGRLSTSVSSQSLTCFSTNSESPLMPVHNKAQFAHTASFAAFTGRALTIFRAGLALNTVGSFVNGLTPARSLVADFFMTTKFAKPGNKNAPFFFNSL